MMQMQQQQQPYGLQGGSDILTGISNPISFSMLPPQQTQQQQPKLVPTNLISGFYFFYFFFYLNF
jgi:hypothetical protein